MPDFDGTNEPVLVEERDHEVERSIAARLARVKSSKVAPSVHVWILKSSSFGIEPTGYYTQQEAVKARDELKKLAAYRSAEIDIVPINMFPSDIVGLYETRANDGHGG